MSRLFDFLQKNTINSVGTLPLVHTSRAHHLRTFLDTGEILASKCDVFLNEKLNYFFVGRPSFKFEVVNNAEIWELPICFIMKQDFFPTPKRVFPFDSGGFSNDRMPSFINKMKLDDFEVSKDSSASNKIIGTFFGSAKRYFKMTGVDSQNFEVQHDLSMLESEINALHRLSIIKDKDFDDRQFAIEVQTEDDCELSNNTLSALIVPSPYLEDELFWEMVEEKFGCEVLGYDCYPINPSSYYYAIYSRVESFLNGLGLM